MVSNMRPVMRPISSCCGSSFTPGAPRCVQIKSSGIRKTWVREVSGLTALPSPEFWIMTAAGLPPIAAPAAVATASPSFAEEM
jgi:hypothetical protein